MPLEVPKTDKVYTTTYENFKGVDFTNDATNIYKRRSPSGLNMMPDLDGKPYKRKGWVIEEEFGETAINNIAYFELAGLDHMAIFTDSGLYMLRETADGGEELITVSQNTDVMNSYERTFFFEGDGTSAFYIYGNYKIWAYKYDEKTRQFKFGLESPYIPRIRISTSADGSSAVAFEDTNMVGNMVAEEFQSNAVPYIESSSGVTSIENDIFLKSYPEAKEHTFTYANSRWKDDRGAYVEMATIGITPSGTSTVKVTVKNNLLVYLFHNISSDSGVVVKVSDWAYGRERFARTLTATTGTPSEGEFKLSTRTITTESETVVKSVIEFHDLYTPLVDGEDAVRVEYPLVLAKTYPASQTEMTARVSIGGE